MVEVRVRVMILARAAAKEVDGRKRIRTDLSGGTRQ